MAQRSDNHRHPSSTTTASSNQSMFSNFEFDQLSAEERLYLHAARMGDMILLSEVMESARAQRLNWDCVDYMGRNALHLAVDSENIDMIEMLIEYVNFESIEEGLLHAISKGLLNIVRLIVDHPRYISEEAQNLKVIGKKDAFFRKEEKYQYPPDITPLILAAHRNDHEIIQLFLSRGYTIQRPHAIHCQCQDCRSKQQCDSLKRSRSRLHAYKALASPAFLALSSPDPIAESFELRKDLLQIAHIEKEFKKDYLALVEQCMAFTCSTLSLCRGTQEMEAILGQATDCHGPLARLRRAIENEEKMFVAHPNTQQHLTSLWFGKEMQFLQGWATWKKLLVLFIMPVVIPFVCLSYLVCPNTRMGRALRCPISKFLTHTMSHLVFLFLLAVATFGLDAKGVYNHSDMHFGNRSNQGLLMNQLMRQHFRPQHNTLGSIFSYGQVLIAFWVIGNLCLECKQVYNSGLQEHFRQYYNIMDYLILTFYLASYALRFATVYRLKSVNDKYNYTELAKEAIRDNDMQRFDEIVARSRNLTADPDNYFMLPSRFQWEWDDPEIVSNVLFALANVLSFARTTYVMPSHELLGPLQISLGRMISDIIRFMVLFLLVLVAFMVGMTNLYTYYGHDKTMYDTSGKAYDNTFEPIESFKGLWSTINTLFFSMFGLITLDKLEIQKPKNIDPLLNPESTLLVHRVGLVLFAMFQVMVTIVLVNMLIAMMSHSFEAIQGDTDVEWKFARTKLRLSFIDEESTLPVPFNIIPTWKTFKYAILACLGYCPSEGDDQSVYQYDFTRRRENVLLVGLENSGLVFSKSSYTDIIQRIMRRYLFKMDREKIENEKKEGTVCTEMSGMSEEGPETATDVDKRRSAEFVTIVEEGVVSINSNLNLPNKSPNWGVRSARYRRTSEHEEVVRRSVRRRASLRPHGLGSLKSPGATTGSSLQLEAIQRGQRLLDARLQELISTEGEVGGRHAGSLREVVLQNHHQLENIEDVLRSMSGDLALLTASQPHRFDVKVHQPSTQHASTPSAKQNRVHENLEAGIPGGSRSNSSPGLLIPAPLLRQGNRHSVLGSIKHKLTKRKSQPGALGVKL